jgi:hypothetical protein
MARAAVPPPGPFVATPPADPEADAAAHREGAHAVARWRRRAIEGNRAHLAALEAAHP